MKSKLFIAFVSMLAMMLVMRLQGAALITPASTLGILDLEFAKSAERLRQLQLFWDENVVLINIALDFFFIAAYTWFFLQALDGLRTRWYRRFRTFAVYAACFDIAENVVMYFCYTGRLQPDAIQMAFYCALIKFILVALIVLYLLVNFPLKWWRARRLTKEGS